MGRAIVLLLVCSLVTLLGCHENQGSAGSSAQQQDALGKSDNEAKQDWVWASVTGFFTFGAIPFIAIGRAYEAASRPSAAESIVLLNDQNNADNRREGMIYLVTIHDYARKPPYTLRYKDLAQHDPDFTVQAMAIRALNISRDASATGIFISALDNDNELIRLEGAKALGNVPDPAAIPGLERLLEGRRVTISNDRQGMVSVSESLDVRIAAADALRQYRNLDVARNLVGYLNEREFAVAWQTRKTLATLTGRDMKYDQAAWLAYLTGPERPLR